MFTYKLIKILNTSSHNSYVLDDKYKLYLKIFLEEENILDNQIKQAK